MALQPITVDSWSDFPVTIDQDAQVLTICGIRYAFDIFRHLGLGPIGTDLRLIAREDGVITMERIDKTEGDSVNG